jgi:streptogramin lyase
MGCLALVLWLVGCSTEAVCVDLRPHPDFVNHVQTFEVAVDPERRRVYATALGSRVLLVVDADSGEVVQDLPLGSTPLNTPEVELDRDGDAWVVANKEPALMRFDAEEGSRHIFWDDLLGARDLVPRAEGGVVVLGRSEASNNALLAYDDAGQVVARTSFDSAARGLVPMDDHQRVGVTLDSGELRVLSTAELDEQDSCAVAIERPFKGAQLDDGTVILASERSIGTACVGAPQAWMLGEENMEVLSMGDHAVVLDRIGAAEGFDPNLGIGRLVDASGMIHSYATIKNTGFGALDPNTGWLWVNSEGSSELVAIDPATGARALAVQTGTFLDGLCTHPEDSSVVFASGRLSNTLVRIDADHASAMTNEVRWPYAPVVDLRRELLWVLSQTDGVLVGLALEDLSVERRIDSGLGSNTLLTFGNIMVHMDRGTLFFAESQQDLLLELDPDSGEELARWDLGGPIIVDPDEVGELALRVAPGGEQVYVVRSNDARLQRIDPDLGEVETVFLPDDVAQALRSGHKTDFLRHFPGEGLMYVGGKAVHLDDLSRWEERDLDVTRLVGRHPSRKDQWIAVDDEGQRIVRLAESGEELGSLSFGKHELYATVFKVSEAERAVYMTRALHGNVCSFPARALR